MSYIFENTLLGFKKSKQKEIWMNCLVAFSGGQDSTHLLILWINLLFLNKKFIKKKISILGCNHLWKNSNLYLLRHTLQISFFFNQRFFYTIFFSKGFSEQKARKYRYLALFRIAHYTKSQRILTAHTQNDTIETFFINLFRGSGKMGLQNLRNFQVFLDSNCFKKFY